MEEERALESGMGKNKVAPADLGKHIKQRGRGAAAK